MNKFSCTTATALAFLVGSSSLSTVSTAFAKPTDQPIFVKANFQGWDVNVSNLRYLGSLVQGKYQLYEAAGNWIAVTATVTNTAGKKQRADEEPSGILAHLIDTSGTSHDADEIEIKYDTNLLNKPYAPHESRTVVILFDVPNGTVASQLVFNLYNGNSLRFKL